MELRTSILKTVAYFDLFNYPISLEDIRNFLEIEAGQADIAQVTEMLVRGGYLYRVGPYYSLQNNPLLAERRQRGEARADTLLVIANRNARLLYKFPFVRGICISGSLSKRFADERADIDYFIITKANRLWLARTFMLLYRRLAWFTGRQEHYCLNYYIDEEALEVEEKNIFTATELFTLLPAAGGESLARFFLTNSWASGYLPRYMQRIREHHSANYSSLLKRCLEKIFDNKLGNWLDNRLQHITARRWKEKEENGELDKKGTMMSMYSDKHYSRPNPVYFQARILTKYRHKLEELTQKAYFFLKEII
jgi:hypothetical protein